jgi:hypothetical protein
MYKKESVARFHDMIYGDRRMIIYKAEAEVSPVSYITAPCHSSLSIREF